MSETDEAEIKWIRLDLKTVAALPKEVDEVELKYKKTVGLWNKDAVAAMRKSIENRIDEMQAFYADNDEAENAIIVEKQCLRLRMILRSNVVGAIIYTFEHKPSPAEPPVISGGSPYTRLLIPADPAPSDPTITPTGDSDTTGEGGGMKRRLSVASQQRLVADLPILASPVLRKVSVTSKKLLLRRKSGSSKPDPMRLKGALYKWEKDYSATASKQDVELCLLTSQLRRAVMLSNPGLFGGAKVTALRTAFADLDEAATGNLSHSAFRDGLSRVSVGLTEVQVQLLLGILDADNTNEVFYEEFLGALEIDQPLRLQAHGEHGEDEEEREPRVISMAPVDFQVVLTGVEFRAMLARKQYRIRAEKAREKIEGEKRKEIEYLNASSPYIDPHITEKVVFRAVEKDKWVTERTSQARR